MQNLEISQRRYDVKPIQLYHPAGKKEIRLVYRVFSREQEGFSTRHQKSFSMTKYGTENAWEKAKEAFEYIEKTGELPPEIDLPPSALVPPPNSRHGRARAKASRAMDPETSRKPGQKQSVKHEPSSVPLVHHAVSQADMDSQANPLASVGPLGAVSHDPWEFMGNQAVGHDQNMGFDPTMYMNTVGPYNSNPGFMPPGGMDGNMVHRMLSLLQQGSLNDPMESLGAVTPPLSTVGTPVPFDPMWNTGLNFGFEDQDNNWVGQMHNNMSGLPTHNPLPQSVDPEWRQKDEFTNVYNTQ